VEKGAFSNCSRMLRRFAGMNCCIPDEEVFEMGSSSPSLISTHVMRTVRVVMDFLSTQKPGSFPAHGSLLLHGHAPRPRLHGTRLQGAMAGLRRVNRLSLLPLLDLNHQIVPEAFQKRFLFHCCQFAHTLFPLFDSSHNRNSQMLQLNIMPVVPENPPLGFWNNAPHPE